MPSRATAEAARGHSCPMPLGFDPPHPGGMTENSPTFQRWVREFREAQVPKGRLKPCTIVTVQVVGRASRLSWGRLALGRTSAGKRPGPAGETPAPLPEQLRTIYQPSLRDLSCCGRWFPTLKRWAIIRCPSGTMMWPGFAGLVWKQILAALDCPIRPHKRANQAPVRPRPSQDSHATPPVSLRVPAASLDLWVARGSHMGCLGVALGSQSPGYQAALRWLCCRFGWFDPALPQSSLTPGWL
jgi:hypothetical protein